MSEDRLIPVGDGRLGAGFLALILALSPAMGAIWIAPAFTTQDGPAHLLNARILVETIPPDSPLRQVYAIRWSLLPNWAGHLALMGLTSVLPPIMADRAMTSLTLLGLAMATFWLRLQVAGRTGQVGAGIFSALVAMNVCWLFGFWSFLVGACLFPVTLGVWWWLRAGKGWHRAVAIALLITLGYFGHLISLGLTVVALVLMEAITPGERLRERRLWTLAGLAPLAVLGPIYRRIMRQGGPISPIWGQIKSLRSQLGWVDPITLGQRDRLPFLRSESSWLAFLAPATLLAAACLFLIVASLPRLPRERWGWAAVSMVLLIGGIVSPDTLGAAHGNYLPQRVILLGLVSLVPWLDLDFPRRRLPIALLTAAALIQGLSVCDYARESSDRVVPFLRAACEASLGRNRGVGTLLIGIKGRFRSNPLLHADSFLGVGTGDRIWANYETIHYYFPVQFQENLARPPAGVFEEVAIRDGSDETSDRAATWEKLLAAHHDEIDLLLVWGRDPVLESINARWFDPGPIFCEGSLRVYRRRERRLSIEDTMATIP